MFHSASLGRDKASFAFALASTNVCQAGIQAIGDRDTRKRLISPESKVSIQKQCKILGVSRTAHYYKPKGESEENLKTMKKIDKEHFEHPAKGVVGMNAIIDVYSRCIVG